MIRSLDTSVLVAIFTVEPHTDRARRIMDDDAVWRISDWAMAEFSSAIRQKASRGEVSSERIDAFEAGLDELVLRLGAKLPLMSEDHRQARALVRRHRGLRAPDALHLAVAQRIEARLVTLDHALASAAEAERHPVLIP